MELLPIYYVYAKNSSNDKTYMVVNTNTIKLEVSQYTDSGTLIGGPWRDQFLQFQSCFPQGKLP